jgi:hypothetical protein
MLKRGRRYIFIPHDYRLPPVIGEMTGTLGFVPDEPLPDPRLGKLKTSDGLLMKIRPKFA